MEKIEQYVTVAPGDTIENGRPQPDLISAFMYAKLTGASVYRVTATFSPEGIYGPAAIRVEDVCEPNTWNAGRPPHDADSAYYDLVVCRDNGTEMEVEFASFNAGKFSVNGVRAWMYLRNPVFSDDGEVS